MPLACRDLAVLCDGLAVVVQPAVQGRQQSRPWHPNSSELLAQSCPQVFSQPSPRRQSHLENIDSIVSERS